jgi:hypothetical protein
MPMKYFWRLDLCSRGAGKHEYLKPILFWRREALGVGRASFLEELPSLPPVEVESSKPEVNETLIKKISANNKAPLISFTLLLIKFFLIVTKNQ